MKIIVGVNGRTISEYFGRSQQFIIFDVEDGKILKEETHANPGHLWFFRELYLRLQIRNMSENISVLRQIVVEHSGFEPLTSTMRM